MVYAGLEGTGKRQKAGDSAGKRMADWCALAPWQESCRIRVSPYIVLDLDDVESNHGRVARDFHNLHGFQKTGDVGLDLCKIAARTFTLIFPDDRIGRLRRMESWPQPAGV